MSDNLRLILSEVESIIDQQVRYKDKEWLFFGVVIGNDDYYYGLYRSDEKLMLLSCVGNFESWGVEVIGVE